MADYTTVANVQALIPTFLISATSAPTTTWVTSEISRVTSEVDVARASGGMAVPATDADELDALDRLCSREVAWQIVAIGGASVDTSKPLSERWHDEYQAAKKSMAESGSLVGPRAGSDLPTSYTMDSPSDTDDSLNPLFSRDTVY